MQFYLMSLGDSGCCKFRWEWGKSPMHNTRIQRCTCGHAKSIHVRMYGPMYTDTRLPQTC